MIQITNEKTNKIAQDFFIKEWGDERIRIHSECVIEACLGMAQNTILNPDVFIIAGWLHDLGRKTDSANHHSLGLDFLNKFLEKHPEFSDIKEELKECILNHRTRGIPETIYGKIFQIADKAALKNRKWLEYKEKN